MAAYVTNQKSGVVDGLATAAKRVAETDKSVAYCKPLVKDGAAIVGSDDCFTGLVERHGDGQRRKTGADHVLSVAKALDVPRFVRWPCLILGCAHANNMRLTLEPLLRAAARRAPRLRRAFPAKASDCLD